MSSQIIGLLGFAVITFMVLARIPIAISLSLVGVGGYALVNGLPHALLKFGNIPLEIIHYDFIVLPLFILMGSICLRAGMASDIFAVSNALFAGRRGSLALASIGTSAVFGSVSGSSLATVSTVSKVIMPQMKEAGYSLALASGSTASGSSLAVLIPPSVILVIYALIAEESLGKLYAAALLPALLMCLLYILVAVVWVRLKPDAAPRGPTLPLKSRLTEIAKIWKIALLFGGAIGGIYSGLFSPTEGAAVGAILAILIGFATRTLTLRHLVQASYETVETTATLLFIVMGATMFAYFVIQAGLPSAFIDIVRQYQLEPWQVIVAIIIFFIIGGCFLDSIGMILMTVPVFLPVVVSLGYDPVWFGILQVVLIEIGLLTPPVGMNCFVLRAQAPDIPVATIFRGVLPFIGANMALVALLILYPDLALYLPRLLF